MTALDRDPRLTIAGEALVLRTFPFREADLIVRVFTANHGKLSLIARGARNTQRKRSSAPPEPLDRVQIEATVGRGSLLQLTSHLHQKSFKRLRADLDKLSIASLICDATDILFKEESVEAPETYDLISLTLESIDSATTLGEIFRAAHTGLCRLLAQTGHLDISAAPPATVQGFEALCTTIERSAERELGTKALVQETLGRFRASNRETGRHNAND